MSETAILKYSLKRGPAPMHGKFDEALKRASDVWLRAKALAKHKGGAELDHIQEARVEHRVAQSMKTSDGGCKSMTNLTNTGKLAIKRELEKDRGAHMEPSLELRIYQWAAGLAASLLALGGVMVWGRLNRHGAKLDAQEAAMSEYKTAAAVRAEQMTNMTVTLGRLEQFLTDHMTHEEGNIKEIKGDIAEIKLTLAALPKRGTD